MKVYITRTRHSFVLWKIVPVCSRQQYSMYISHTAHFINSKIKMTTCQTCILSNWGWWYPKLLGDSRPHGSLWHFYPVNPAQVATSSVFTLLYSCRGEGLGLCLGLRVFLLPPLPLSSSLLFSWSMLWWHSSVEKLWIQSISLVILQLHTIIPRSGNKAT